MCTFCSERHKEGYQCVVIVCLNVILKSSTDAYGIVNAVRLIDLKIGYDVCWCMRNTEHNGGQNIQIITKNVFTQYVVHYRVFLDKKQKRKCWQITPDKDKLW